MNEKLRKAILNNNDLYEAVFKPHKINFDGNDKIRYSLEKVPPLYSNLVTISQDWKPDEIFKTINENFKNENWKEWSIKDSFGVLDLTKYDFEKLFDASWIYLESINFKPIQNSLKIRFEIIENEKTLQDWRKVWDENKELGKQIFQSEMLNDSSVFFLAGYRDEKIITGCLINKTENVLGISNFFSPEPKIEYWSEIIRFIYESVKIADIVGYEREDFVEKLQPLGFEAIGDLTVWLRKTV